MGNILGQKNLVAQASPGGRALAVNLAVKISCATCLVAKREDRCVPKVVAQRFLGMGNILGQKNLVAQASPGGRALAVNLAVKISCATCLVAKWVDKYVPKEVAQRFLGMGNILGQKNLVAQASSGGRALAVKISCATCLVAKWVDRCVPKVVAQGFLGMGNILGKKNLVAQASPGGRGLAVKI